MVMTKQLRRVRTLGRGASGAVVWLASDDASGELVAVKSACAAGAAAQLQREGRVLEGLSSPHIVPCLGARAAAGGEYQLLLEFAPGGSLADEAARRHLGERDIAAYAGDVARALAYLHGRALVHGDVKARNVVIGADGRARLTDFGCARPAAASARPVGGTPAFMAPEVARGEAQGPPADVWALGCTVVEMATGRAPWAGDDDLLAALHRIGYTDAVPEVPAWLSPDAKDFLSRCFQRRAASRSTAAQLLVHPFVAAAARDFGFAAQPCAPAKQEFPSPNTTLLHDAFWDSDTDGDDEMSTGAAERIGALACAASALPDWDSDDGWIDLRDDRHTETVDAPPAAADYFVRAEPSADAELEQLFAAVTDADAGAHLQHLPRIAGVTDAAATISQDSYLRTSSTMHLVGVHETNFDHDGMEKVESRRACNRNSMIIATERISPKISPLCDPKISPLCDHLFGTHSVHLVCFPPHVAITALHSSEEIDSLKHHTARTVEARASLIKRSRSKPVNQRRSERPLVWQSRQVCSRSGVPYGHAWWRRGGRWTNQMLWRRTTASQHDVTSALVRLDITRSTACQRQE